LLSITLQAGLSALKTPQCRQHEDKNLNCPVCDTSTLGALAESLPLSHHVNSSIVCRLSGKKIDENNPPMLLPNGRVYSLQVRLKGTFHETVQSHDMLSLFYYYFYFG
jgi:macrophage erythroblast attacher